MKHTYIEEHDIGEEVACDFCGDDYTNSTAHGGFLFQSKAVCPKCAPEHLISVRSNGEERFIRGFCPPGMSFKDWVLSLRNGDNRIRIVTVKDE